jgi:hypothetical protein
MSARARVDTLYVIGSRVLSRQALPRGDPDPPQFHSLAAADYLGGLKAAKKAHKTREKHRTLPDVCARENALDAFIFTSIRAEIKPRAPQKNEGVSR